jgi:DNA recombination protein RmuC
LGFFKGKSQENQSLGLLQQQMDTLRHQMSDSISNQTNQVNQQLSQVTQQVNQQLNSISQHLQNTSGNIGSRLDHAAKVVGEVRQNLGELTKATEKVFEIGKNISTLQEILRAPKLRGVLGELFLGDLLNQVLPQDHYSLQHRFKNGEIVDAVVKLGPGLVPIDAKFPLENFRRILESHTEEERRVNRRKFNSDVKKHIDSIATKYILPDEGTFPFALMYLPAENVYYEIIVKEETQEGDKSISNYALNRKVIPVSPHSFYAYLQAIVFGLKGLKIERSAMVIINHLEQLKGDFERFRKEFVTLGTHLTYAKGKYDDADKKLNRVEARFSSAEELTYNPPPSDEQNKKVSPQGFLDSPREENPHSISAG